MSDVRNDARDDRSIQIDPDTCRSILADEIPGEWEWCEGAFELDGPAGLEVRVRVELNEETDRWTIEPTINGDGPGRSLAPRLGLHGTLEDVAERLREAVLVELDRLEGEARDRRLAMIEYPDMPASSEWANVPLGRTEWLERVMLSPGLGFEITKLLDLWPALADCREPSEQLAVVLAAELLESPDQLEEGARRTFGERLQEVGAELEARGRAIAE